MFQNNVCTGRVTSLNNLSNHSSTNKLGIYRDLCAFHCCHIAKSSWYYKPLLFQKLPWLCRYKPYCNIFHTMYEEMLGELHYFMLKKRELREETLLLSSTAGEGEEMMEPDFHQRCAKKGGNGQKLEHPKFKLAMKKFLFTTRMVKHWNKLPRNAVGFSCVDL